MKHAFIAFSIFAAGAAIGTPANAQNYPWCEYLGGFDGGGRNCGFVSYDQCMASAWGNGGDCRPNTTYTPPPGPHHEMGYAPAPYRHHVPAKARKSS